MKPKLISKAFFNLLGICFFLFGISSCTSSSDETSNQKTRTITSQVEGVYKYLPPGNGAVTISKNHFIFYHGSSESMVTDFGTYKVSNDTVYNKILDSSNPGYIGYEFKWAQETIKGDTIIYVVYNNDGEIVSRGKCLRLE